MRLTLCWGMRQTGSFQYLNPSLGAPGAIQNVLEGVPGAHCKGEMMEEGLLTVQEAANLLRVHRNTIYNMIHDGRLPAFKVGRVWRVQRKNLPIFIPEPQWQALPNA